MFAKHTENFVDDNKLNHKWRKDMTVPHEDMLAKTRVKNLSYHKTCNFSKSPGRGGLFLEVRILVCRSKMNGSLNRNSFSGSDKTLLPLKVALICRYIA